MVQIYKKILIFYKKMAQYNYWPRYGPENYSFIFSAEEKFDPVASTQWMLKNWSYSIVISILYVIMIFVGQMVKINII